jgi:tetratricopeptide (TPR) repeat protein
MLTSRRIDLHRRAADWFEGNDLILHAEHLDKADQPGAAQAYLDAARQEAETHRHERARQLVVRAQQLDSTPQVQFELACTKGDLLRDLGSTEDSIVSFQQSLELAEGDDQVCRANIGLSGGLRIVDRYDEAFSALDEAQKYANGLNHYRLTPVELGEWFSMY